MKPQGLVTAEALNALQHIEFGDNTLYGVVSNAVETVVLTITPVHEDIKSNFLRLSREEGGMVTDENVIQALEGLGSYYEYFARKAGNPRTEAPATKEAIHAYYSLIYNLLEPGVDPQNGRGAIKEMFEALGIAPPLSRRETVQALPAILGFNAQAAGKH